MIATAAVLFGIAALGGVTMALIHFFKGKNPPIALVVIHGLFAASGLVVFIIAFKEGANNTAAFSLGLFMLAALGGFWLLSQHLRNKRLPSYGVIAHALVAVIAFAVLLLVVLGHA